MQNNTLDEEEKAFMTCLVHSVDIQYRRLGLYSMAHIGRPNCWQVHCEDSKLKFSQLFYNLKTAVQKFIELKYKLDKNYGRLKK